MPYTDTRPAPTEPEMSRVEHIDIFCACRAYGFDERTARLMLDHGMRFAAVCRALASALRTIQ